MELLLESYHKICDEVVQEAGNLVTSIRNTEEIVRAILDANRNSLMLLDLKFSIGTLGLAMGTFLAGLYGMNLENFIEETHWGFGGVTSLSIALSLLVCYYGAGKLRKLQRVTMRGEGPGEDIRYWFRQIGAGAGWQRRGGWGRRAAAAAASTTASLSAISTYATTAAVAAGNAAAAANATASRPIPPHTYAETS